MGHRRSVAWLIETSNAYARGVLEGIIDYTRHHERWSLFVPEQERGARPPNWLNRWKGDGIIARIETDEIARVVRKTKLPVVDVSAARHLPDIPWVETDDGAIAKIAAEHLVERGFRHLAFCGDGGFNWSNWRQHRTDYEAASLLDRMMSGEKIGSKPVLLKPLGIETRQSTDILAIDDPDVAAAVRFIRENATSGINVGDVLREVPLSRRILENRFRKTLGRTPHEEITRIRIDRIKRLLSETDLALSEIAARTGFQHDEYMTVAFKKAVGMPPSKFRQSERS